MSKKIRILVIDDDQPFAELLKYNLEGTGIYEVLAESLSIRALQSARSFRPDIVLLDYVMPDLDGGEVATKLREDPSLCGVPVIMVTALLSNSEVEPDGSSERGGYTMLAKPIRFEILLDCIEKHLTSGSPYGEAKQVLASPDPAYRYQIQ